MVSPCFGLEYQFEEELEGKKFHELSEEMQAQLDGAHITIHIIESSTPVEIAENLANRLNMKHLIPRGSNDAEEDTNIRNPNEQEAEF